MAPRTNARAETPENAPYQAQGATEGRTMSESDTRRWRQVMLASATGQMMTGWIPADIEPAVNTRVDIDGQPYTLLELYRASTETRDSLLPTWDTAKPWKDVKPA